MKKKLHGYEVWKGYNTNVASDGSGFVDCSLVAASSEMTGSVPVAPSSEADANSYRALGITPPKPGSQI